MSCKAGSDKYLNLKFGVFECQAADFRHVFPPDQENGVSTAGFQTIPAGL